MTSAVESTDHLQKSCSKHFFGKFPGRPTSVSKRTPPWIFYWEVSRYFQSRYFLKDLLKGSSENLNRVFSRKSVDASGWRKRNNDRGRTLKCYGHKCSILPTKLLKTKLKFYNAGADASFDANAGTKMPMPKFPNGLLKLPFQTLKAFLFSFRKKEKHLETFLDKIF